MSSTDEHALWRQQYQKRRYLEFMTDEELKTRFSDLSRNTYVPGRDGKLHLRYKPEKWLEWLTHVDEERVLRRLPEFTVTIGTYPNVERAAELWDSLGKRGSQYLVKFGQRKYMSALYEEGRFRVSPASSYNDSSLNSAIRDNENVFTQESISATVKAPPARGYRIPLEDWKKTPIIGTLKVARSYPSDFYVSCFAARYEYRLFDDFRYDSCVVIWNAERFMESLGKCGDGPLRGWRCVASHVQYWDPFNSPRLDNVLFAKHVKYSYQDEYRIVWEPGTKQTGLTHLDFVMGPLKEYCDFLSL